MKHQSKVFVVDSNLASMILLEDMLSAQGYSVKCFHSASDFLEVHHPTEVGCVVIDLELADMDVSDLLDRLQGSGSMLSAIVLTSVTDSTIVSRNAWSSISILKKPYDMPSLLSMIVDGTAASVWRRARQLRSDPRD